MDSTYSVAPANGRPERLEQPQDIGIRFNRAWGVDYSGDCGAPVLMAVVDQIRNGPVRRWVMHTEEREVQLQPDGFELRAANGATLRATVIVPAHPRVHVEQGTWTNTIAIDGDGDFFVVMTVQPAGQPAPRIERSGTGLASRLKLGRSKLYYDGQGIAMQ